MLASNMDERAMLHRTGYGGHAIHTMISRGHIESVKIVIEEFAAKLRPEALSDVLNYQIGRWRLGAVPILQD